MRLPTDPHADQIARLYRDAEQRLRVLIAEAVQSGRLATAAYRRGQLAEAQKILAALHADAAPQAVEAVGAAYKIGTGIADIHPDVAGAFTGIHQEAVTAIADNLTSRLGAATVHVGRRVDDVFRQQGLRATAAHLIEGSARREASKDLVNRLTARGVSGFTDKAGRDWGMENYARMVVRTTTREAVTAATTNRLAENGLDLVTWIGSNPDDEPCGSNDGQTFSLTGATDGYDVLDSPPPAHPNCQCVLAPAVENLDRLEARLAAA